jgi:hypothetical protein
VLLRRLLPHRLTHSAPQLSASSARYSSFEESLNGLPSIRAFGASQRFIRAHHRAVGQ